MLGSKSVSCLLLSPPTLQTVAAAPAAAAAASFSARRAAPSALHSRRCPARQSACEQAVPQYQTAQQALHERVYGAGRAERLNSSA